MLDETDRKIIQATQAGLPLTPQPYQAIAEQLGLTVDDVMMRLSAMQNNGIIRRIGAVPNHYKLGYRFNGMTVWDVPDEAIDELGQKIGQLEFVSHCYHRPRHLGNRSMHCSTSATAPCVALDCCSRRNSISATAPCVALPPASMQSSCVHAVVPEWPYNLFAMVHGKSQEEIDKQIQQIYDLLGDNNLGCDVLYSTKILKKTGFRSIRKSSNNQPVTD